MATNRMMRLSLTLPIVFLGIAMLTGCPQSLLRSEVNANETGTEGASVEGGGTVPANQESIMRHHVVPGRILVQYRQGVKGVKAKSIIAAAGGKEVDEITSLGVSVVELPGNMDGEAQVNALSECPEVEFAELDPVATPDFTVNDPSFAKEWHLTKIAAPTAWDTTQGSSSVIIAILDTGVNANHADLAAKIVPGWNTCDNNADTSDVYGHGTPVAGSAAASSNNGVGVAAPAINCKIMPMRISDVSGNGYGSTVASALVWAADHGARVANVSYFMDFSATVTTAAKYFMSKGGVVTMSAGNESKLYAAAADNPYILTVGASTSTDTLASFTNTGTNIDLVSPGCGIYTTTREGGYASWSGTSFSAPITAGVAALVISAKPGLTGAQVQTIITKSSDDFGAAGYDTGFGWGRLNAAKAVALAKLTAITTPTATSPTTDTTRPVITLVGSSSITLSVFSTYTDTGATAYDNKDGNLTAKIITVNPVNPSVLGTYLITYNVRDTAGNTAVQKVRTVKVVDKTKPVVTLNGSSYPTIPVFSAYTELGATATDNYDGNLTAQIVRAGSVNTSVVGTYYITYTVKDSSGNTTITTRTVKVVDKIKPVVTIKAPVAGTTVSGPTSVAVTASDNVAVVRVELYVDNILYSTATASPFTNIWSPVAGSDGVHTLICKAYDAAGNVASSPSVSVTLKYDNVVPTIAILSPISGATVSGSLSVTVSAKDNVRVKKVQLIVDGKFVSESLVSPYTNVWNTSIATVGTHTIVCKAFDNNGNIGVSKTVTVKK